MYFLLSLAAAFALAYAVAFVLGIILGAVWITLGAFLRRLWRTLLPG